MGTLFVVCVLLMAACDDGKGVENVLLPPAGNITGSWTGTYDMNDIETNESISLPATASFEQKGSTVTGTLRAPSLYYLFQGVPST